MRCRRPVCACCHVCVWLTNKATGDLTQTCSQKCRMSGNAGFMFFFSYFGQTQSNKTAFFWSHGACTGNLFLDTHLITLINNKWLLIHKKKRKLSHVMHYLPTNTFIFLLVKVVSHTMLMHCQSAWRRWLNGNWLNFIPVNLFAKWIHATGPDIETDRKRQATISNFLLAAPWWITSWATSQNILR